MKGFHLRLLLRFAALIFLTLALIYASLSHIPVITAGLSSVPSLESSSSEAAEKKDYIKWVDFDVTYEALDDAYRYDVDTHGQEVELHWIELLAYLACKNGGDFSHYQSSEMKKTADALLSGETTMQELTCDLKYYSYYYEAYSAVLSGMIGNYEAETFANRINGETVWEESYGLKCFHPIAKGFPYTDYDDFGASRSYGYKRSHLGHDMMGQIGTPITAVESGYVEALGWNQYGGWRVGIRSFDKKRYYYYAHLRQNYPFAEGLEIGSVVTAGDVIGYMGHTGYSTVENTNNIDIVHLHFGMQLIFDESQKDGSNQIWIDPYQLVLFLCRNRSETQRVDDTREWERILKLHDPAAEAYSAAGQANGQ